MLKDITPAADLLNAESLHREGASKNELENDFMEREEVLSGEAFN